MSATVIGVGRIANPHESAMQSPGTNDDSATDAAWSARLQYWRRKLRRLRLEAEPLETQLARYRRVTWALTAIPLAIALMFVALFSAFRRPDVGIVLALILLAPVVVVAWIDDGLLRRRAAALHPGARRASSAHGLDGDEPRAGSPGLALGSPGEGRRDLGLGELVVLIEARGRLGPFVGFADAGLQLGLQPLAGGVEPTLDRPDRRIEAVGDLDQRLALDVEGDQDLAVDGLDPRQRLPEVLGAFAGDQPVERVVVRLARPAPSRTLVSTLAGATCRVMRLIAIRTAT